MLLRIAEDFSKGQEVESDDARPAHPAILVGAFGGGSGAGSGRGVPGAGIEAEDEGT